MTIETIVDIFGSFLGKHLVSRRVEKRVEGPCKGIKTYRIELWDVEKQKIVVNTERTCQLTSNNRELIIEDLEKVFIQEVFNHYASKQSTE